YNTGSFNAGDTNTGGFNPGSTNTGWFNTGNANTGVANAGNVNTGALITGNFSNGILWRGNYEGLAGFSFGYPIPLFPAVGADVTGDIGPATIIPPIHIPSIPLGFAAIGHIGPISIPNIAIPSIHLGIDPTFDVGPITVDPITLTIPGLSLDAAVSEIRMTSGSSSGFKVRPSFSFFAVGPDGMPGGEVSILQPFTVAPINLNPTTLHFPGFTIPTGPIHIGLPLSLTIPGFTIPGGTLIPQLPLGLGLSGGTPPFDLPTVVIDRIPVELHASTTIGPVSLPIFGFGGAPGFGNDTTAPSSGFFNTGGGGGSGFSNSGSGMSGVLNAISDPLLGSASGFANFGTQLSGILNRGAGISGVYNTGTLGLVTSAFVSGFMNVGQQLSGLLFAGTGP
ncbi:pentapeptide repeat-containing protein, partial [Mycobacterium tuberculosis]